MSGRSYGDSKRAIEIFANKVQRRLSSIPKRILDRDDIVQELSIAWFKANEAYDPEIGVPFGAYLQNGMKRHINRVIEKHVERFEGQTFALSIDAPSGGDQSISSSPLSEIIPDTAAQHAVDGIISNECFDLTMNGLSERARIYVSILIETPKIIRDEMTNLKSKSDHATRLGAPFKPSVGVTSSMIFDIMGSSATERHAIKAEITSLSDRISNG